MQVEIYPADATTPVKLTGERPEEGVSSAALEYSRVQALVDFVEGLASKGKDYGNEKHGLTFSIWREHDSEGAASFYWLTHPSSVPPTGRVKFTHLDGQGNLIGITWLNDAIIAVRQGDWQSHATRMDYTIQGGTSSIAAS